ncbi:hypothetical protein [Olsenella phocaeensis]|uniref:hypothetical protein n=1 Tax=Olsenella phocaeensis TaxID=1852385 RepID=UPI000931F129|nr:hypothetical protein [Olsenella phocaeensis]
MPETNVSYPEAGVTKAADIAPEISIDYVNRFTQGIQKLQAILGVSNLMPVPDGGTIKTYKYTSDIKKGNVAEGEYIPLSSVKKTLDQTYDLPLNKWRRNTTAEAVQARGLAAALNDTDAKFVAGVQKLTRDDLYAAVTGTQKTSKAGKTLQATLASMWGALEVVFEDYEGFGDLDGGDSSKYVFFVNPTDVADYLGTATISTQTAFGINYLKDFLGLGTVIPTAKVEAGAVYGTAAQNLNIAYVPANGSAIASTFGLTSDATGLIGMTHSIVTTNATVDTLLMSGMKVFPEVSDAVLKGSITPGA